MNHRTLLATVSDRAAHCLLAALFSKPGEAFQTVAEAATNGTTSLDKALLDDQTIANHLPVCLAHLQNVPVEDYCWDKMLPNLCLLIAQRASVELLAHEATFKSFLEPKTVASGMRTLHLLSQKLTDSVRTSIHEAGVSQVFTQSKLKHDPHLASRAATQFAKPKTREKLVAPSAPPPQLLAPKLMPEKSPFQGMVYMPRPQVPETLQKKPKAAPSK
jgi:hypothetical protein